MKKTLLFSVAILMLLSFHALVSAQCGDDPIDPALDIPADQTVTATSGVVYLAVVNGDTPVPNACGLNPSNDPAEWMGWGGPLDHDNMSIGEGVGTRNLITISGIRYERGIGTHGTAVFVYDLSGGSYSAFHAVGGVDDEKTCGTVQFVVSVDGAQLADTGVLSHDDAEGAVIDIDIPDGASELTIEVLDAGDGIGCDHADLGDPYLVPSDFAAVAPSSKLSTTWGSLKR